MIDKAALAARKQLWKLGELEWKLKAAQKELYHFIKNNPNDTIVINTSRRYGKTTTFLILAMEQCIKHPRSLVKFSQPTQKMIRTNVLDDFNRLIEDCPKEMKPKFNGKDSIIEFPNGSKIQLAGTDGGNAESLRGGSCHLALVDEAGFCDNLNYIIQSIIGPTTDTTNGKIILASTTPPDSNHEFIERMRVAGAKEALIVRTVRDALEFGKQDDDPIMTPAKYTKILNDRYNGNENDIAFQTEYLCKITKNAESSVIPEFDEETEQDVVVEWFRPDFCDKYVSMDVGFVDFTFCLFSFYDFEHGKIVIEDELVLNGKELTTDKLAQELDSKEKKLWYNRRTATYEKPSLRVADNNNLILLNDLARLHELYFTPTAKDNREAQINVVRMMIQSRQIVINPRCKNLIAHIKNATWDKQHKDFKRSEVFGHYDGVMALVYLVRNIDKNKNPYPKGYRFSGLSSDDWFIYEPKNDGASKGLKDWAEKSFTIKKKRI